MSLTITSAAALASVCDIAGVVGLVGVLLHAASPRAAAASVGRSNGLRVLGYIGLASVSGVATLVRGRTAERTGRPKRVLRKED
jgi:hypothetical protein